MTTGSAFPLKSPVMTSDNEGMTLRDYFAAKAMQGLIAAWCLTEPPSWASRAFNESEIADQAYSMADAVIGERNRK